MKVYVISLITEDGTSIEGVFSEKKMAQEYIENHPRGEDIWEEISEFEVNEFIKKDKIFYYATITQEGDPGLSVCDIEDWETEKSNPYIEINYDRQLELNMTILADNRKDAEEIIINYRDKLIEEGEWIYNERVKAIHDRKRFEQAD